jgi:phosphoribosylglycinamide formyltransferase-1
VHHVTAQVDAGPILGQAKVAIEEGETHESLAAKVHAAEHELLPSVIARMSQARPAA